MPTPAALGPTGSFPPTHFLVKPRVFQSATAHLSVPRIKIIFLGVRYAFSNQEELLSQIGVVKIVLGRFLLEVGALRSGEIVRML